VLLKKRWGQSHVAVTGTWGHKQKVDPRVSHARSVRRGLVWSGLVGMAGRTPGRHSNPLLTALSPTGKACSGGRSPKFVGVAIAAPEEQLQPSGKNAH
jgi:hypothetical protein